MGAPVLERRGQTVRRASRRSTPKFVALETRAVVLSCFGSARATRADSRAGPVLSTFQIFCKSLIPCQLLLILNPRQKESGTSLSQF